MEGVPMRQDLTLRNGFQPAVPRFRASRFLTPRQRREQMPARDAEARVEATAAVTRAAMMHAEFLVAQQARATETAPDGVEYYHAFLEAFATVAYSEISGLGPNGGE
jgi:hypothetical protein